MHTKFKLQIRFITHLFATPKVGLRNAGRLLDQGKRRKSIMNDEADTPD